MHGLYWLDVSDERLRVSLENIERDYSRDREENAVRTFAARALALPPLPRTWREAKDGLRISAEPAEIIPDTLLRIPVSEWFCGVVVHVEPGERTLRPLGKSEVATWRATEEEAWGAARENMNLLLDATPLAMDGNEEHPIVIFDTPSVLKASLVFAPKLRVKLEPLIGWPALLVIPCRDFALAFRDGDDWLLGRLGPTVLKEFEGSGYPLTPEVIRVSDSGVEAIGSFATRE